MPVPEINQKAIINEGFTLVEIMVALLVLACGLIGMAGMTMVMMRGSRSAEDLANATNICQQKIEEIKDVTWSDIGTAVNSSSSNAADFGLVSQNIMIETNLNSQGKTRQQYYTQQNLVTGSPCYNVNSVVTACNSFLDDAGPYKYTRSFVICNGINYTAGPTPPSGSTLQLLGYTPKYTAEPNCMVSSTTPTFRPQSLSCDSTDIITTGANSPEKMVKMLCSWRAKDGRCSFVNFESLRMNNL